MVIADCQHPDHLLAATYHPHPPSRFLATHSLFEPVDLWLDPHLVPRRDFYPPQPVYRSGNRRGRDVDWSDTLLGSNLLSHTYEASRVPSDHCSHGYNRCFRFATGKVRPWPFRLADWIIHSDPGVVRSAEI